MTASKVERMAEVVEAIRDLDTSPLYAYRREKGYKPVIGEGDLDAKVMLIGEAPGAEEAKTGRPFVGSAGQILDELLASIGLGRQDVYITNVVKDRPPSNRDPRADEIALYAPFLRRQIEIIEHQVIVTLGRFAMDFILEIYAVPERGQRIGDLHGRVFKAQVDYGEIAVVPLYHPAAAFYNQDLKSVLWEDIKVLEQFLD
ncbi:MAG: uracil-DNA glycosylase family protein [Anaerolineae bacterium]